MDKKLQELIDHHEIRKTLAEYCHACDRADADMMASVYTGDDSFDDHGLVRASGPEYARQITAIMLEQSEVMSHILGQSLIRVDGTSAAAETFFLASFKAPGEDGEPRLNQLFGRFIDQLECIEGQWKIKHRVAVRDSSITLKIDEDFQSAAGFTEGSRDGKDPGAALLGLAHHS